MPRLLEQVRSVIRLKHYSIRTEAAYAHWIKEYILFHRKPHPLELGPDHVSRFLSFLAEAKYVSASTQNQAARALVFLYREVLAQPLPWLAHVQKAKTPASLPVVFTKEEVRAILTHLDGTKWLRASLLYGSGLRLMECLRLRVMDIDFEVDRITVRDGKGGKDRITMLPTLLKEPLKQQLSRAEALHEQDLKEGYGKVYLPNALERKYRNADQEWDHTCEPSKQDCEPSPETRSGRHVAHAVDRAHKRIERTNE